DHPPSAPAFFSSFLPFLFFLPPFSFFSSHFSSLFPPPFLPSSPPLFPLSLSPSLPLFPSFSFSSFFFSFPLLFLPFS
ncbi:hypothetical protein ACXWRS_12175, partial [Streptococcus pyogenes]